MVIHVLDLSIRLYFLSTHLVCFHTTVSHSCLNFSLTSLPIPLVLLMLCTYADLHLITNTVYSYQDYYFAVLVLAPIIHVEIRCCGYFLVL